MKNMGAYALKVLKQLNGGELEAMSDAYFNKNIYGKVSPAEISELAESNFVMRQNPFGSGGVTLSEIEKICNDVPEISDAIKHLDKDIILPRTFDVASHNYVGVFASMKEEDRAPYIAYILTREGKEEREGYKYNRTIEDPRLIYAICFGIWDTKLDI